MPYLQRTMIRGVPPGYRVRRPMMGFGDFNDETPCASIPAGDPYRKPGNYCATPDGGYTTFNADGTTYVDPSAAASATPPSTLDKIGAALANVLGQRPVVGAGVPVVPAPGMSTTTKVALVGGAVLLVALVASRR